MTTTIYNWTLEREEELIGLVAEGQSYSQIARIMGCSSRNIPLCKFNRLRAKNPSLKSMNRPSGRSDLIKPKLPRPIPREKALVVILKDKADIVPLYLEDGGVVTLENVSSRMCRFPIGDPCSEAFKLCGHPPKTGSSYCADHHRVCYMPTMPHRRKDYVAKRQA